MIGLLGRWNGSLTGSCVPCLCSSSVGSRSPSIGLRCSALGLLKSFLGLLGCSATCWLLDPQVMIHALTSMTRQTHNLGAARINQMVYSN
jgi:hypothetical protein